MRFLAAGDLVQHVVADRLGKELAPDLAMMAMNQGSTSTINQARPANGRSDHIQRAERSAIESVTAVSTTNIRINGPLSSTPPASAVHKIAGSRQPMVTSGVFRLRDKCVQARPWPRPR